MSASHAVRCFFNANPRAGGNPARVMVATGGRVPHPVRGNVEDAAQVIAELRDDHWRIDSFTGRGDAIRFCGHGALAAAFVLFDRYTGAPDIRCCNGFHEWTAERGSDEFPVTLRYARPEVVDVPVPATVADWLGVPVTSAAHSGGPQGYLLLQLDSAAAISALRPDFARLQALTPRAVIVAAPDLEPVTAVLRYFAPQYGVNEDAATGSAAVQLASWWFQRTGRREMLLHQQSATGGWLRLLCNTGTVELSGRVAYG